MVAREVGFIVEAIRRGYPDCVGKRQVSTSPERWAPVRIEFEYASNSFNHPPSGADLIVCWVDDLNEDAPLPVLELQARIRKLDPNK